MLSKNSTYTYKTWATSNRTTNVKFYPSLFGQILFNIEEDWSEEEEFKNNLGRLKIGNEDNLDFLAKSREDMVKKKKERKNL